ncbi:hypothetical protein EMIHUDRAFT_121369 [Emiliania huxleyi CCMP1516]|uniref:AB hydrolase-1 domain-containing protein n=2 Tax=Emiliania huxleyi TaxID=2903 RepID=A0A0D3I472_EMIH1|nr:hypothetical protein EMIHUDRAFT_121369 [Emiliania huxleyi CCMP1516]EOD06057.1 hypothetical protein EMIHUDRAFT_121369 [Emiliania huxleyi CCMP1516]|eukprot:XP_005758486.1 hypothetical protein EMIHUDRAFT_121369 [Emiliania huxleyi CCMP1516]
MIGLAIAALGFGTQPKSFSLCEPNPEYLVWDIKPEQTAWPLVYLGWLKVPILHDQPGLEELGVPLGYTALRVSVYTRCAPAAKPLLSHCGGPGTDNSCHLMMGAETNPLVEQGLYDNLAITQRGIATEADNRYDDDDNLPPVPFEDEDGTPVTRFPTIKCLSPGSDYTLNAVKAAFTVAGRDFKPVVDALTEAGSKGAFVKHYLSLKPELVEILAHLNQAAAHECRTVPEYQLGKNVARGRMVYQDFAGTTDLAHDLDLLRRAIGATHLSIWGISYGTEVGGVYASIFPNQVDKLILDGNVPISEDIYGYARVQALSFEETWSGLAAACDSDFFSVVGPTGEIEPSAAQMFAENSLGAKEQLGLCAATPYPTEKLVDILQQLEESPGTDALLEQAKFFTLLDAAFQGASPVPGPTIMSKGIYPAGSMLMACIQSYVDRRDFKGPGCCFKQANAADEEGEERRLDEEEERDNKPVTLVRAVDIKGRLSPPALARLWEEMKRLHPLGAMGDTNYHDIAVQPNLPRPTPPKGRSFDHLTPLIIGQFGDPATVYSGAQMMQRMFPNGVLLSWQGYKHGLPTDPFTDDPNKDEYYNAGMGAQECYGKVGAYLETGVLPKNGDVCPINGPTAGGALNLSMAIGAVDDGYCIA